MSKNIVIIGGGPGGYVAALRAAQLNAQVTLIEMDTIGGTCLNRGCIPTKVLLHSADIHAKIKKASIFGVLVEKVTIDFAAVTQRKKAVVNQLVGGVTSLLQRKKNQIRIIKGVGTILDPKTVGILGEQEKIKADNIIIATGSKPAKVSIKGIDEPGIITSDEALSLEQIPKKIIIIGGGVIGLEFGQIFQRMGSKVTILEIMSQILPSEDKEIANTFENILKKEGIEIITETTVKSVISTNKGEKVVTFTTKQAGSDQERIAEKVLLAVGRTPNIDNLGIEKIGLAINKGKIIVNKQMETNIPGIFAIGDVVGKYMLAHVAMEEGKCAVENCMGFNRSMDYRAVPRCVYTSPELAGVGITESEAKENYGNIKVARYPLIANGKALILNETAGLVKIITDERYGQILGVQIISPNAVELIGEAVLGIKMEATFEDIASTIHAHPTISEAIMEAALGIEGKTIHF